MEAVPPDDVSAQRAAGWQNQQLVGTAARAVRAARAAPGLPLARAAEAAGSTSNAATAALGATMARSVCARAAMLVCASPSRLIRLFGLDHRACPPPQRRAAAESSNINTSEAARARDGWGAWASSRTSAVAAARRVVAMPADRSTGPAAASPPLVLAGFARDIVYSVREQMAANRACPPAVLAGLVEDPAWQVRAAAAANRACPAAVRRRLRTDPHAGGPRRRERRDTPRSDSSSRGPRVPMISAEVRRGLRAARSAPQLPLRTVAAAAGAGCVDLHESLVAAGTARVCDAAAAVLASPPGTGTAHALVLAYRRLPPSLVRAVTTAADLPASQREIPAGTAAWSARARSLIPATPRRVFAAAVGGPGDWEAVAASRDDGCPPAMLATLAAHPEPSISEAVARNPSSWPATLAGCVSPAPSSQRLRAMVARNPRSGSCVIQRLAADPQYRVRGVAAAHRACPNETVQRLTADASPVVRCAATKNPAFVCSDAFVDADDEPGLVGAAANPSTPQRLLERLAGSAHPTVRSAAARNPRTSPQALAGLAEDTEPAVRSLSAAAPPAARTPCGTCRTTPTSSCGPPRPPTPASLRTCWPTPPSQSHGSAQPSTRPAARR